MLGAAEAALMLALVSTDIKESTVAFAVVLELAQCRSTGKDAERAQEADPARQHGGNQGAVALLCQLTLYEFSTVQHGYSLEQLLSLGTLQPQTQHLCL